MKGWPTKDMVPALWLSPKMKIILGRFESFDAVAWFRPLANDGEIWIPSAMIKPISHSLIAPRKCGLERVRIFAFISIGLPPVVAAYIYQIPKPNKNR
jgi:hypothetical protein